MPRSTPNLFVLAIAIVTTAVAAAFAPSRQSDAEGADGTILYVDDDAPANGDGLTWKRAFRFLQDALHAARQPGANVAEIRVAGGVYRPDQGANVAPGDVQASFEMVSGVALRGGYAGHYAADPTALTPTGAHDPNARDIEKFESILSADLLGNDGPAGTWLNYAENSQQIVHGNDLAPTLLEGLTMTASNVDWETFTRGGGLSLEASTITINECVFELNLAYRGGGVHLLQTDAIVQNCVLDRNQSLAVSGWGGGMLIDGGEITLSDCMFSSNSAQIGEGGGLFAVTQGLAVRRCQFHNNSGDRGAGAAASGTLIDCSFVGNTAAEDGGGFRGVGTLMNCVFTDNYAGQFGGGVSGLVDMVHCSMVDNFASFDGGAGLYGGGDFVSCEFRRNVCGGTPPAEGGAGAWITYDSTFANCVFNANDSWGAGGAVYVEPGVTASFAQCTFAQNITTGDDGGAISGSAAIANSILWHNLPAQLDGEFIVHNSCVAGGWAGIGNIAADPKFVDVDGLDGVPGTADDDLRLAGVSPCIDAGDNASLPQDAHDLDGDGDVMEPLPIDLAGGPRLLNDPGTANTGQPRGAAIIVDMGAFEFDDFDPLPGDANGDGIVNVDDIIAVVLGWGTCAPPPEDCPPDLDGDGEVDVSDLLSVILHWTM